MRGIAIALGILATLIGVWSASSALNAVGGDPAYGARLWAVWASLVLALLAGVAAVCMTSRPRAASLTMLISGILGFVCIYLYYIDTFYMVALRLWFLGTILACISASTPATEDTRTES